STDANPFPSMMGRVCPAPCEQGCNRNNVDDFVGINSVEQYIGDSAKNGGFKFGDLPEMDNQRVAIIGGGPAGLAAAYQLRRKGIASTIFDEHDDLGGMFRYGIPGYRTPREFLDHEINRILEMGYIDTRMGTRVGSDVTIEELEKEFDAILWAIGCQSGRDLPLVHNDAPNCISGVAFLEAFNKGALQVTSNRVVCVGGGDTSIDVVSVARR
ncbi:MAG: FAD-dependent oxidoreductase, partial [Gammaproteobacteria bacterium]|nr:FAD-dependent oxidoreductase [Gammaproteobacteria bacterium]